MRPIAIALAGIMLLVGLVALQYQHKHRSDEPTLVRTGIEKRARIVTDVYAPPPGALVMVRLPQPRPKIAAPATQRPMSLTEKKIRCTPDAIRLCAHAIPNRDNIIACMQTNKAKLSARCAPVFAKPLDANGNEARPLKASKRPCEIQKRKVKRAPTVTAPVEYHDGASQWSRDHPGSLPGYSDAPLNGHGGAHHSGGHPHAPQHHTLC